MDMSDVKNKLFTFVPSLPPNFVFPSPKKHKKEKKYSNPICVVYALIGTWSSSQWPVP